MPNQKIRIKSSGEEIEAVKTYNQRYKQDTYFRNFEYPTRYFREDEIEIIK